MKFTVEIELGSEKMSTGQHVGDALAMIVGNIYNHKFDDIDEEVGETVTQFSYIHDIDGNRVGSWEITE